MNFPKPSPGHVNCVGCRTLDVEGCEECRRCKIFCGCICRECYNCSPTRLDMHGHRIFTRAVRHHPKYFCRMCDRCLRKNSDGLVGQQCICHKRPSRNANVQTVPTLNFNSLPRFLGLEIECSYVGRTGRLEVPDFVKYQWVHDGSITAGGQEMVLQPLAGDQFLQGIAAIGTELAKYNFKADNSCGFHVHVGVGDVQVGTGSQAQIVPGWGAYELRRLVVMYSQFEDLFYQLVAPGRDGYRLVHGEEKYYARRWKANKAWIDKLMACKDSASIRRCLVESLYSTKLDPHYSINGTSKIRVKTEFNEGHCYCPWPQVPTKILHGFRNFPNLAAHKYEQCRYYGLNLHTFFQRGTVEYRMHEGTVATDKLIYWPLWCGWFTHLAGLLTDMEMLHVTTVDQLLDGVWSRWTGAVTLPQPVKDWVRKTLKERGVGERDF